MIVQQTIFRRRCDRIIPVITLVVACGWAWGTYEVAGHVKTMNMARMIGAALTGGMTDGQPSPRMQRNPVLPFLPGPSLPNSKEQVEDAKRVHEQIVYVEGVVYVWETMMYLMVRFLVMVGIVSLITRWTRRLHLSAAVVIILSTAASLVGLNFLIDPERGGLPPLSIWAHVLLAIAQSSYGVLLLIVFARNTRDRIASSAMKATAH